MSLSRAPADPFCDRLRLIRDRRGYSQDELARRTGLQPSAVSHFETGTRKPSFDNLRRLADALDVTVDYLLGRVEEPNGHAGASALFRDYEKLNDSDRESLEMMARMMAGKGDKKR